MTNHGTSTPDDFGAETLMDAVSNIPEANRRIHDRPSGRGLNHTAERIALLQALADRGVVSISAGDGDTLTQLAEDLDDFSTPA